MTKVTLTIEDPDQTFDQLCEQIKGWICGSYDLNPSDFTITIIEDEKQP